MTQTDKDGANSVQNVTRTSELINSLKGFPESWKKLFTETLEVPVRRIEEKTIQPGKFESTFSFKIH